MSIELNITLHQIQRLADPKVFERGKHYHEDGSIINRVQREHQIEAFCHGSGMYPYRVTAILNDKGYVSSTCTCPYDWGGICKHEVALLLTYLLESKTFEQRPTTTELLRDKSQADLISIIEKMTNQYPQLLEYVDEELELPEEFYYDEEGW